MPGDDTPDLVGALTRLQALMLAAGPVNEFLHDLVGWAAALGEGPLSCSITLRGDREPYTVTSSDTLAAAADELQYAAGTGPCLDASAHGGEVYVEDMPREQRWDGYPAHAASVGVGSSFSLPLTAGETVVGALNLYSGSPHAFGERSRRDFRVVAAQAAGALTMVRRQAREQQVAAQLEQALSSRAVIDQAVGVVMARGRCTADEAFALLRAQSQGANRKLRDLAADVVREASGREPVEGGGFRR